MKQLYQYWREKYTPLYCLHTHTFLISFSRSHTQPKGLSFIYLVSVFNQCLKCISLSSTFPSFPGVHGNWTLTDAYVCNFADGGGAARRTEQGGGWRKREEEWEMGFAERLRTRTFFVFKAFPWKCWGEANALSLDRWRFHLLLATASFSAVFCVHACERVRKKSEI